MKDWGNVLALVTGLGGLGGMVVSLLKVRVDARTALAEEAEQIRKELREDLKQRDEERRALRDEIKELRAQLATERTEREREKRECVAMIEDLQRQLAALQGGTA